jgi:RNA polymerase sigma-70 factor (ECF subfamily)
MNKIKIAFEQLTVKEESQRFYSVGNKTAAVPDSPVRRYTNDNRIINHKESSDEELARSFCEAHDEEAFNELVNRYADKIYRLALRIIHNPSDAEEVLQKVFITLSRKLNTFRGESKFSTWLYGITVKASSMHLRAGKKYGKEVSLEDYTSYNESGALEGVEMKDWSDRPDDVLFSREAMEIIERAASELPVDYRVVLHLRDVEGFSNEEAAKILELSVAAVKSRLHRARLFLRDRLSDCFYECGK